MSAAGDAQAVIDQELEALNRRATEQSKAIAAARDRQKAVLARRQQKRRDRIRQLEEKEQCELCAFAMMDRAMSGEIELRELRACINHVGRILRRSVASGGDADGLRDWMVALTQTISHVHRTHPSDPEASRPHVAQPGAAAEAACVRELSQGNACVREVDMDDLAEPGGCSAACALREKGVVVVRDVLPLEACRRARGHVMQQFQCVRNGDDAEGRFFPGNSSSAVRRDLSLLLDSAAIKARPRVSE